MKIEILTLFPEIFAGFLSSSLIGKAQEKGLLSIALLQIRSFAEPPQYHVDDTPYGGGAGMVMRAEVLSRAIEDAKIRLPGARVVLLTPAGRCFSQSEAHRLSGLSELILICGRYEGVDQRVIDLLVDDEISIGDYVLMGGEIPAMAVIEATVRLVDKVVGNSESIVHESFSAADDGARLLEAPHYTRPPEFRGIAVPEVLKSGNHALIEKWRAEKSIDLTRTRRPDLLKKR